MKHHSASTGNSGLYGILSHTIMMVTANTTVLDALTLFLQLFEKLLGSIHTIVSVIRLHFNASFLCISFERDLCLNGFMGR